MIETREHAMARLAVADCLRHVKFGDVLIFTDKPDVFRDQGRIEIVPDWPDKVGWSRHNWQGVAPHVTTSHALGIQWDSWVVDPEMWRDQFLDYDYVGAPWWYKDGMNVGNGGFCLRSTKLMRFLRKHRDRFPCVNALDDDLLCRKYRPAIQEQGFVWAPEHVALDFAFECTRPIADSKHFGFHSVANFDFGCGYDRNRLLERARIMKRSRYMTVSSPHLWEGLVKKNPWITDELEAAS